MILRKGQPCEGTDSNSTLFLSRYNIQDHRHNDRLKTKSMVSSPSTCPTWITNNGKHSEAKTNDQNRQTSMNTLDTISKLNCQYLSGDRRRLTRDKYQKYLRDQGEWLEENMTPLCYSRYESCDARRNNSVANSRGAGPDTKRRAPFWLTPQKDAHNYEPKRHRIMSVHTSNLKGRDHPRSKAIHCSHSHRNMTTISLIIISRVEDRDESECILK